jgi:hypothetical protein
MLPDKLTPFLFSKELFLIDAKLDLKIELSGKERD